MTKNKPRKKNLKIPAVTKIEGREPAVDFPLAHYSYSTFIKALTNPILFKINYINGDRIDSLQNISGVIGQSFHTGLEAYYTAIENGENDPIKIALEVASDHMDAYQEGFIEYSESVKNKQKATENLIYALTSYFTDKKARKEKLVACERMIEQDIDIEWRGQKLTMPVRLKGYIDKIVRDEKGRLKIIDYKTCRSFSDPEKIDGAKIIQAVQYYFLVYAEFGEAPHSIRYEEVKMTKNRDGSPQIREYEMVFEQNEMYFDFYLRVYQDVTRWIMGESVFMPNVYSFFDNEVSIMAYILRLDVTEELRDQMEKMKVKTITDLLKKEIQAAGTMRRYMKAVEEKFVNAATLKYDDMTIDEKIRVKMLEHGMRLDFDSIVSGHTVDLYKFQPNIGIKMSKILQYVADIEQVVGSSGVRILAPIPNTSLIGVEVPKKKRSFLGEAPVNKDFELAIGVDTMGDTTLFDIREAPHMLVAGATGSGKSVFLNSIISQLGNLSNVELHLLDPKIVELSHFEELPQTVEYLTEPEHIYNSLKELVNVMNDRYKKMATKKVRNIKDYKQKMKYKFVVFDEFGDITASNHEVKIEVGTGVLYTKGKQKGKEIMEEHTINISKDIARFVQILAQKGRAAGIHLIIATQRPSVDIISGSIKNNFPTKAVFRMAKEIDSRVVIDESGAEKLLGKGDMLFASDTGITRLQGFNA